MIANEKNEGIKIKYELNGNLITFGDDQDLTLNLKKYERAEETQIDITMNVNGLILVGTGQQSYFIAQITIPAKEYVEGVLQDFDIDKCTLDLWGMNFKINEEIVPEMEVE